MSKFFIERPILANVIAIVTIVLGLVCLINLPVAQYPNIVPPTIRVSTSYPGASADVIATTVGIPLEQGVNGVEGSIYMQSTSGSDGSYALTITFAVGTDLNGAIALVQNAVNGALSQLPDAVQQQGVSIQKVSTNILLIGSLYSDDNRYDETFLSNYAIINLQNPLARLPGVGQVQVLGAGPYSMRIWLDPVKLKAYGLTVLEVQQAIQNQNIQVAAGQVGGPPVAASQIFQFTVKAMGRLSDVAQFENIIVKARPPSTEASETEDPIQRGETATIVRIKDIAKVELSQESFSTVSGLSGKKAAQMNVYTLPGANALKVSQEVRKLMTQMSQKFPAGLKYDALLDTSTFIKDSIGGVYDALLEAGILVLIVIILFLQNFRAMLVPATTVPVTIIGAFAAMALLGFTVNLMTLFALILAIGIVVDDAIVIVENASHYIEQGLTPKDAAIKAMSELTGPVLGITLVLTSVFLPASFLPGITGQMFRQFALVIASTAIISALNALTLKPTQCALYLRPIDKNKQINWFYRGFNRVYDSVELRYIGVVRWMAGRPRQMVYVFIVIVGSAGVIFAFHPSAFLPLEDQGYCLIIARLPAGASQPRMREVAANIDSVLKGMPGIKGWVTSGGYSDLDSANLANVITEYVMYEDFAKRPAALTQDAIVANLQNKLRSIQKAAFSVLVPPPIPGLGQAGGFQMMIEDRGSVGIGELQKGAQLILRKAAADQSLQGVTTTFSADSPQLYIDINRTMVESLGVSINDVFQTLQTYLGSTYINLFNKFNQSFQVRVQGEANYRRALEDIQDLNVANRNGQMVPLGTMISVHRALGSELLTRYNLYPAVPIIGGPAPGYSTGQGLAAMETIAHDNLPLGMAYDWTGLSYQEKLIGSQAYFIFALSITLVFLVLAGQYESWTSPAAVVITVPMALVGVIVALVVRNFPTDLYTQIGLVLMIALAAKNAILIVEFARDLKAEGMKTAEAAVEATRRRFRPILMTSIAFILSVVPLLTATGAGAASQQALGTVVFGGMLASTLLAIPFVPIFFIEMEGITERREARHAAAIAPATQSQSRD
ncbi:MAG TPA: efflux RND transporter permease subunit [Candidatus Binataceae bacterium]